MTVKRMITTGVSLLGLLAPVSTSAVVALLALLVPVSASADITVLCSNGLKAVMDDLAPQYEKASKEKVTVKYDLAANLKRRIEAGEAFDVAILTPAVTDDLIKQGKLAAASKTTIARSNLAVAIKAGSKKTDVSTTDGFKRVLLGAKAVAFAREGASGVGFMEAMKKLGIADQVKQMPTASGEAVGEAVLKGTADLGILPVSEILPIKGAEVLGEFPGDVASYIVMVGGVNASSKQSKASKGLIDFLMAPAAMSVVKAKGMERVAK